MTSQQQQPPGDGPSGRDRRLRAPLATPADRDYGSMSRTNTSATNEPATSASQPHLTSGEPPRAAVRRKIQQQRPLESAEKLAMETEAAEAATADQLGVASAALVSRPPAPAEPAQEQQDQSPGAPHSLNQRVSKISSQLALQVAQQNSGRRESDALKSGPARPYPKKVLLIVANEFCERFSYYGLRTVLVLYFRSVLGFSDSSSTISYHLFTTLCYLTPILGAILGDSILGKYKTILYLSSVYLLGEILLVVASVFWDLNWFSVLMTWTALLMIGVGTGGIKPCVSAFGGDQFQSHETKWRENFFSLFYGAINLGSLISMFLTPMLRAQHRCVGRSDCYPLAFSLPAVLMLVSIAVFLLAHNYYYIAPLPDRNVILAFAQCTWLALKRKLQGYKLTANEDQLLAAQATGASSSASSLSMISSGAASSAAETETAPDAPAKQAPLTIMEKPGHEPVPTERSHASARRRRSHWLYLASDSFDTNSIEEFRCVLGIFFLFLPTPMFWALFDQQGSLWTLQATRMDGRILGTRFVLEPDQMMVFNPILLLASIPLFQLVIYPTLNKCNLLTTPIQKMTTGGFLAALTFVVSALVEFHIQASMPAGALQPHQAGLLLVNGVGDCSLMEPSLVTVNESTLIDSIAPLSAQQVALQLQHSARNDLEPAAQYRLTFKLGTGTNRTGAPQQAPGPISYSFGGPPNATAHRIGSRNVPQLRVGCPFDPKQTNELHVGPLAGGSMQMLYIQQGNGKLSHKLFEESLAMPESGKARVRLLYEYFGSHSQAVRRQFRLSKDSSTQRERERPHPELRFNMSARDGQVLLSDYTDIEVAASGDTFTLKLEEPATNLTLEHPVKVSLAPGTRNLLLLHQTDAKSFELRHELVQDNQYRVSVFYQLAPYMLISASEVLFSITGLEFSYSMAPPNMKSLILGAWCLTTAFGNLLTVAIESIHFFDNIGYDFLLYAALMALDILLFAIIGYNYEPYQPALKPAPTAKSQ